MPTKQLKSLIKLLRASGVTLYECDGLKLTLDTNFVSEKPSKSKAKSSVDVLAEAGALIPQMSDEDWLLSTNGPPQDDQVQ